MVPVQRSSHWWVCESELGSRSGSAPGCDRKTSPVRPRSRRCGLACSQVPGANFWGNREPEHRQHVEFIGVRNVAAGSWIHGDRVVQRVALRIRHLMPAPRGLRARVRDQSISGERGVVKCRERLHAGDVNGAAEVTVADGEWHLGVGLGQDDVVPRHDGSPVNSAHYPSRPPSHRTTPYATTARSHSPIRWWACSAAGKPRFMNP